MIDKLYTARPLSGQIKPIPWKQQMASRPLLRRSNNTPLKYKDIWYMLTGLGDRCGYMLPLGCYQYRRGSANIVADHAFSARLSQILGYKDLGTIWRKHYLSKVSNVDVQNLFHGEEPNHDWPNRFRGLARYRQATPGDLRRWQLITLATDLDISNLDERLSSAPAENGARKNIEIDLQEARQACIVRNVLEYPSPATERTQEEQLAALQMRYAPERRHIADRLNENVSL